MGSTALKVISPCLHRVCVSEEREKRAEGGRQRGHTRTDELWEGGVETGGVADARDQALEC